ncbi:MAG: ribbon-helix-helix protein, CopG family [Candidatus Micrarchaeaceae archaeon]|uniref:ribbon-helix-helix protein, CopG family n=1 Tax=Metallosphaera sp. TaxID=2020860 RepID=UPI0031622828
MPRPRKIEDATTISIHIPKKDKELLQQLALKNGMLFSEYVRAVIQRHLEEVRRIREEQRKRIMSELFG